MPSRRLGRVLARGLFGALAWLTVAGLASADRLPAQVHIGLSSDVVDLDAGNDFVEVRLVVDDALLQDVRRAVLVWRPDGAVQSRTKSLDFPVNTLDARYRMTFPAGAVPGRWRLVYLRLEDSHGTSRELYPGTPLEVRNSNPDLQPPVVTGVDIWPPNVDLTNGDRNVTVTMFANDDREVQKGWVYLRHAASGQRKTVELPDASLSAVATFAGGVAGDAGGTWVVNGVALYDGATNRVFDNTGVDDGNLQVEVTNPAADTTRPTLDGVSLSSTIVDVTGGRATLDVTVDASDAGAGIATIEGIVQSDDTGQQRLFGADPATGLARLVFDEQDSSGQWRLTRVSLIDAAGNQRDLTPWSSDPASVVPDVGFDVLPQRPAAAETRVDIAHPPWLLAGGEGTLDIGLFAGGPGGATGTELRLTASAPVAWGQHDGSLAAPCSTVGDAYVCPTGDLYTFANRAFRLPFSVATPGVVTVTATLATNQPEAIPADNVRVLRVEVLDPAADADCDGLDNASEAAAGSNPLRAQGGTGCAPWLADDVQVLLGTDQVDVTDGPAGLPLELVLAPHRTEVVRVEVLLAGPSGHLTVNLSPATPQAVVPFDQRMRGGQWYLQWANVHDAAGHSRELFLGTPFRVTNPSPGDRDGPVFRSLTVSPQTIDVSDGPVEVTVAIDADDVSGVREARLMVFNMAANRQRDFIIENPAAGSTFTFSAADPPGAWDVRTLLLLDGQGTHSYRVWSPGELPAFTVVNDGPVSAPAPPLFHGVTFSPGRLDVSRGGARLRVAVDATPGGHPLAEARVQVCHTGFQGCRTIRVPFPAGSTEAFFDTWDAAGTWAATSVHLEDAQGKATYFPGELNPVVFPDPRRPVNARFDLVHARPDDLSDLTAPHATAPAWVLMGEEFRVRFNWWKRGPGLALDSAVVLEASRPVRWGRHFVSNGRGDLGACAGDDRRQDCAVIDPQVGPSGTYFFRATADAPGALVFDVAVSSRVPDPRPGDTATQVVVEVLDPAADHDGDGASNADEAAAGTDPLVADAPADAECDPLVCRSSILLKLVPLLERR